MIIQTIGLDPPGAVWTDEAPNVSRLDPSGAIQADAEHPTHHRKVVGSNPTSGSVTTLQRVRPALLAGSGNRRLFFGGIVVWAVGGGRRW